MIPLSKIGEWAKPEQENETPLSVRRLVLQIATAVGYYGVEEQLLRLMSWLGAKLTMRNPHSRLKDPIDIIIDGNAWCDQHCQVFQYFAWNLLGVNGRELAIYHSDGANGHTVIEMFYLGAWHLFDPHSIHQAIYRSPIDGHVLDYDEITSSPLGKEAVLQENHWWMGKNEVGKWGFYDLGAGAHAGRNYACTSKANVMQAIWAPFIQGKNP